MTTRIRVFVVAVLSVARALAQSPLVTVSDTITYPNGTHPSGTATISWPRALNDANPRQVVVSGQQVITITSGVINVALAANASLLPAGTCYRIQYALGGSQPS